MALLHSSDGFIIKDNIFKGCHKNFNEDPHIGQMLFDALNKNPEHIGMIDAMTGKKTKFSDMKEKCIRLAVWMRKEGIVPGDIVSLFCPPHRDVYIVIIATYFVGATYNPLAYAANIIRHQIRIIRPKLIFVYEAEADAVKEAVVLENNQCTMIVLGEKEGFESLEKILDKQSPEGVENFKVITEINPKSIGSICFTSGTTGLPKGIPHSFEQVKMQAMTTIWDKTPESDIHLCYFYPSWGINIWYTLNFILKKTTQIFHQYFDPSTTCLIIERYKVTQISIDTYKFTLLISHDLGNKQKFESLKAIIPLGTRVTTDAMEKVPHRFPNAFVAKGMGLTETGCLTRFTKECRNILSEGIVEPNIQLTIKDVKTGEKLGPNQIGELCVKAPQVMDGYYKNPEETNKVFDDEGWFHSGDEAYYDENGEVLIAGRIKEIIRFRDIDIQSFYVEDLLIKHPDVAEAAIVGVPHAIFVERPIAFIKTVPGSKVTKDELSKIDLKLKYNDILQDAIEFIDEIPRNTNGKINKKILKDLAKNYYE